MSGADRRGWGNTMRVLMFGWDWRELVLFNESFHGDSGRGVRASHQTGWTGLVTRSIEDLAQARVS